MVSWCSDARRARRSLRSQCNAYLSCTYDVTTSLAQSMSMHAHYSNHSNSAHAWSLPNHTKYAQAWHIAHNAQDLNSQWQIFIGNYVYTLWRIKELICWREAVPTYPLIAWTVASYRSMHLIYLVAEFWSNLIATGVWCLSGWQSEQSVEKLRQFLGHRHCAARKQASRLKAALLSSD